MQICYTSKFETGTPGVFRFERDCKKRKDCKREKLESASESASADELEFLAGVCCWNDECNKLDGPELVEDPQEIRYCYYPG